MIKVVGCRILVKPLSLQEHDKAYKLAKEMGLVIPELTQRKQEIEVDRGTVLEIGESCHEDYVGHLKTGDVIGYARFGGKFIRDPADEQLYLVINDEDVVCIYKDNK